MRGDSGLLRWTAIAALCVLFMSSNADAGPARLRRMIREVVPSNYAHSATNETRSPDICTYNGKEVLKSSVVCVKNPGCRKIEIFGECCPSYQCDCDLNGKIYENGEKQVDPITPCHVCLCRGGEFKCNNVTCYKRNDCGKTNFIDGVCCPEYDSCPPLEDVHAGSKYSNATTDIDHPTKSINLAPTQRPATVTEAPVPLTTTAVVSEEKPIDPNNPLGIKIKEITKPEEIRVTDDKSKPPANTMRVREFSSTTDRNENSPAANVLDVEVETVQPSALSTDGFDEAVELTPDGDYGGFSVTGAKNTRQTEDNFNANGLVTVQTDTKTNDSLKTNQDQKSDVVIIDGTSYTLKEAFGLQRGEDEEDERKTGRRAGNDDGISSTTDSSDTSTSNQSVPSSTSEWSAELNTPLNCSDYINGRVGTTGSEEELNSSNGLSDDEIIYIYECSMLYDRSTTDNVTPEIKSTESETTESDDTTETSSTMGSAEAIDIIKQYEKQFVNSSFSNDSDLASLDSSATAYSKIMVASKTTLAAAASLPSTEDEANENGKHTEFPKQQEDLSTHGEQMQQEPDVTGAPPPEKIEGRSPGEPLLVPEFERNVSVHRTVLHPVYASSSTETELTNVDVTAGPGTEAYSIDGAEKSSIELYDANDVLSAETVDPLGGNYQKKEKIGIMGFLDSYDLFKIMQTKIVDKQLEKLEFLQANSKTN